MPKCNKQYQELNTGPYLGDYIHRDQYSNLQPLTPYQRESFMHNIKGLDNFKLLFTLHRATYTLYHHCRQVQQQPGIHSKYSVWLTILLNISIKISLGVCHFPSTSMVTNWLLWKIIYTQTDPILVLYDYMTGVFLFSMSSQLHL